MAVTGGIMSRLSAYATDQNILGGIIAGAVGGLICACSLAIAGPLLTKGFVGAALFSTLGGGFAAGVARYGINQLANGNEFNGWEAFGYGAIGALINLVALPFSFVAGGLSTVWEQILMDSLLTSIQSGFWGLVGIGAYYFGNYIDGKTNNRYQNEGLMVSPVNSSKKLR